MTNQTQIQQTDQLAEAIRHYNWLAEANTTGRVGRTPEAWDAAAARIEAAVEHHGVTGDTRRAALDRAKDARQNAEHLRQAARRG